MICREEEMYDEVIVIETIKDLIKKAKVTLNNHIKETN